MPCMYKEVSQTLENMIYTLIYMYITCVANMVGIVMSEGIIDLRLTVMLLVGMSWADVLSVMLARGVMCDVRHPRQEEAL